MFKKLISAVCAMTLIHSTAFGAGTQLLKLKDMEMTMAENGVMTVQYKGETIVIESKGPGKFTIGGQPFQVDPQGTMESVQNSLERTYKASKKRSASLDELFIPKAHALGPMAIAIFMGMAALIGHAATLEWCRSKFGSQVDTATGAEATTQAQ